VLNIERRRILYFDPMGLSPDKEILSHINNFIHHRLEDRYKWIVEVQKNNQKQTNGDDCGVFVCLYSMSYMLKGVTFTPVRLLHKHLHPYLILLHDLWCRTTFVEKEMFILDCTFLFYAYYRKIYPTLEHGWRGK
jgi:Ulp1 family protease